MKRLQTLGASVLALFLHAPRSQADVGMDLQVGGAVALVGLEESFVAYGPSYSADLIYQWWRSSTFAWTMTGGFFNSTVVFSESNFVNEALYTSPTLALGLMSRSAGGFAKELAVSYFVSPSFTITNTTRTTVNDAVFKHSTAISLTGGTGMEFRLGFVNEIMTGQFTRHERMRVGFITTYVTQTFDTRRVDINTNDQSREPTDGLSKRVSSSFDAITVRFTVGIAM